MFLKSYTRCGIQILIVIYMKYVLQVKYILYYDRLANLSLFNKLLNIMTSPKKV
jgi:hypothetical protein